MASLTSLVGLFHGGDMKVAILVQGKWRTGSRCWPKILAGFEHLFPDVYYLSHEPEKLEEIRASIPTAKLRFTDDLPREEYDYANRLGTGVKSLQVDLRQLADLRDLSLWVAEQPKQYNWWVRVRADLDMIILPEDLATLERFALYVPCHCSWWGYNDKFGFGLPDYMRIALERYNKLTEYMDDLAHKFHMETFLKWSVQGCPIRRTRATFGIWRALDVPPDRPYYNKQWGDVPLPEMFERGF
jgi:hypothetical protein